MSGESIDHDVWRSRLRHIRARILVGIAFLAIVFIVVGFTQGWFASTWLKIVAAVGIVVGIGGILPTFFGKEERSEIINLVAIMLALVALIISLQEPPSAPLAPEPPLSAVDGLLPYWVSGTGKLGLLVRTCPVENCGCPEPDCNLLGTAGENGQVWVQCSLDSGYVPPGEPHSIWYKVRWPNASGGTRQFFESTPRSPHVGWVFSRYLTAAGPNGTPSSC